MVAVGEDHNSFFLLVSRRVRDSNVEHGQCWQERMVSLSLLLLLVLSLSFVDTAEPSFTKKAVRKCFSSLWGFSLVDVLV